MSDLGFIQSSPKKEYTGIKTIRSLTVKQVLFSEHEENSTVVYVDNRELSTIKIIGWVSNVKTTNTGKSFLLEDSTGNIECMMWCNKAYEEYLISLIEEGSLFKVVGILKEYGSKKSIQITNLYPVEDYNELIYHMSSVVQEHLMSNKKEPLQNKEMKKIHNDLLECIRNNQDEESGLDLKIIIKCLQNEYNERMIKENLDFLVDNCYLIITDENGYKCVN
ncbi:hypothetical protein P3W45_001708 [Vairimorpha bombi]|jgi:replication factor A2